MIRRRTFAAVAVSAALVAGCGGSAGTATTTAGVNDTAASKASVPRNQERRRLIAEGRDVVACLHQAGYRRDVRQAHTNTAFFAVRGNGVVAPTLDRGYGFPVVKTGLQSNNGGYVVGIASTPRHALTYLGANLGFPGGSTFDGSYDGSVILISYGETRDLAGYKSDRAGVAACAFSVGGASGHPKPAPKRFR